MGYTGAVGDGVADISGGYGKILLVVDIAVVCPVEILLVMLKKSEQLIIRTGIHTLKEIQELGTGTVMLAARSRVKASSSKSTV